MLARKTHRLDDVRGAAAAQDQAGAAVDHGVPDLACFIVARVVGPKHSSGKAGLECLQDFG